MADIIVFLTQKAEAQDGPIFDNFIEKPIKFLKKLVNIVFFQDRSMFEHFKVENRLLYKKTEVGIFLGAQHPEISYQKI